MLLGNRNIVLDSREVFFKKIKSFYSKKNQKLHQKKMIEELSVFLADYFFKQYSDFRVEYPKSIKRYSSLKLSDLDNPFTHDKIISFIREKFIRDYVSFCSLIFEMTENDFLEYGARF